MEKRKKEKTVDSNSSHNITMQAVYSTVRENFKRIQDFGWYLPSHHSIASFKLLNGDTSVSSESGLEGESSTRLFYRRAAVLFLLSMWKGELHVLMTKRSQAVRTHKGDDCLPGGMQEPGETSPVETALREAWEETGLERKFVDVIAVAPPFCSGLDTLTMVSPVVATLNTNTESLILTPDGKEVDCIYWMPIKTFLESMHGDMIRRKIEVNNVLWIYSGMGFNFSENGKRHYVWGLTAQVCTSLSAIALDRVPDFPCSSNRCISNIWADKTSLTVSQHDIALTTGHLEEWDGYAGAIKSSLSIDRWSTCDKLISKL